MTDYYAVERDGNGGYRIRPTAETGPIHIDSIEEKADLPTVMMDKTYPVDVIIDRLGTDDMIEVGPMGGEKVIGLYAAHLEAFVDYAVESPYDITIDATVKPDIERLS